jgi:DNA polymerase-1
LLKLAKEDKNKRVYSSFLQTGTATGRLSSKNPNLQNIPTRTEIGNEIRKGFVAKEDFLLVGLDYSQIELRLLAHFSMDKHLLQAFREDLDIHLQTAVMLFGKEEAKNKRAIAKSVNFGLLYGMGSKKLSETINVPLKEAKEIIKNYFENFSDVKRYFEKLKNEAKKNGYIQTLLKRRRYFAYERANAMQLAMYEREAINSKFQGSAADLVKLAMNKIYQKSFHTIF